MPRWLAIAGFVFTAVTFCGETRRHVKSTILAIHAKVKYGDQRQRLIVSVTISGLSVLAFEHSGDPGEPDRQSVAFGRGQSVEQFCVPGAQLCPDLSGSGLPVVCELESVEASVVWVPLS